jgi:hypothetical protein
LEHHLQLHSWTHSTDQKVGAPSRHCQHHVQCTCLENSSYLVTFYLATKK